MIRNHIADILTGSDVAHTVSSFLTPGPSTIGNFVCRAWQTCKGFRDTPNHDIHYICSSISLLKWSRAHGYEWDTFTCDAAAKNGFLASLKYLHENDCKWDRSTCDYAAENGRLACLKYLHENGCPWSANTCVEAAENDHLDCLKYLHENNCEWDTVTCKFAAENGSLDTLKYAHKYGCPWDGCSGCGHATLSGHDNNVQKRCPYCERVFSSYGFMRLHARIYCEMAPHKTKLPNHSDFLKWMHQ